MELARTSKLSKYSTTLKHDFKECYIQQCKNRNISIPSKLFTSQTDPSKLKLNADRIKLCDWEAMFPVLKMENSLKEIQIYSKKTKRDWPQCVIEEARSALVASAASGPSIFTRYILEKFVHTLGQSLARHESLCEKLYIELPLGALYCKLLCEGLRHSTNLCHISLAGCCIGNDGCVALCDVLKAMPNIRSLDLSECKLGVAAAENLANLVRSHSLMRSSLSWESSFRYRSPSKKVNIGLVRLTLNRNPLGDDGAKKLADVLIEDSWIKAIDLQQCQICNNGATHLLNVLIKNTSLKIIDIRGNNGVCKYLKDNMQQALEYKSQRSPEPEIQWLPLPQIKNNTPNTM